MGDAVGVGVGRGVGLGVGLGWGVRVGAGVSAATVTACTAADTWTLGRFLGPAGPHKEAQQSQQDGAPAFQVHRLTVLW